MSVRLTPLASRELNDILDTIEIDSPNAATSVASRIDETLDLLASMPGIGRATNDPSLRQFSPTGLPYLIVYGTKGDGIRVMRIRDGRREPPTSWRS